MSVDVLPSLACLGLIVLLLGCAAWPRFTAWVRRVADTPSPRQRRKTARDWERER